MRIRIFEKIELQVCCRSVLHLVTDEPRWTGRALVRPRTVTASLADKAVFLTAKHCRPQLTRWTLESAE